MARVYTDPQHYTDIANAIREKNGTGTQYKPENMATAIRAIVTDPTINAITITQNGTYSAPSGVDGYSPVTVNVSSGAATIAFIAASFKEGETCTCTDGTTTLDGGTTGECVFAIPRIGTWTVSDGLRSENVTIAEYGQREEVNINLRDELIISDTRLILTAGGRNYTKTNTGDAVVCYVYRNGYTQPLLVSKTQAAVSYSTCGQTFVSSGNITYDDETWYYCNDGYAMGGDSKTYADPDVKINTVTGVSNYASVAAAAKDLLDYYHRVI